MKQQRGFTLIELVMVIVILGILAAVAIPKFVDLKGDAQVAAVQGVAGGVSSASAVNYASRSANSTYGTTTANMSCDQAAGAILQGGLPSGYSLAGAVGATGTTATCTVSLSGATATATASIIAIN